jgi:NAD(P)-dependent dehydrogenase (short-subunit alcohol dehydrogenase family)
MKSIVITGVSTGIGRSATQVLMERGFHVFGSVRKQADAERLAETFGDRFTPLLFDVTDEAAIAGGARRVREALKDRTLAGLVNNAGIAVSGPLLEIRPDEFRKQLEVNLTGAFMVTQAFAPLLGADSTLDGPPGRIVNISSIGGIRALPFLGPYAASKHGLEGFSEALRMELMLYGIDVIVIGPGPVRTEIWDKAEEIDLSEYEGSPYLPILRRFQEDFIAQGRKGYPPERLGQLIHKALTTSRPRVRYAADNRGLGEKIFTRLAPRRVLDRVIARTLGLERT